jgi:Protein of unknown function (DUF2934)
MKPSTLKPKFTERYVPAPTIHTPQLPKDVEQIRKRAQEIYAARGGMMGMTLNDWLKAELKLKQRLAGQTN